MAPGIAVVHFGVTCTNKEDGDNDDDDDEFERTDDDPKKDRTRIVSVTTKATTIETMKENEISIEEVYSSVIGSGNPTGNVIKNNIGDVSTKGCTVIPDDDPMTVVSVIDGTDADIITRTGNENMPSLRINNKSSSHKHSQSKSTDVSETVHNNYDYTAKAKPSKDSNSNVVVDDDENESNSTQPTKNLLRNEIGAALPTCLKTKTRATRTTMVTTDNGSNLNRKIVNNKTVNSMTLPTYSSNYHKNNTNNYHLNSKQRRPAPIKRSSSFGSVIPEQRPLYDSYPYKTDPLFDNQQPFLPTVSSYHQQQNLKQKQQQQQQQQTYHATSSANWKSSNIPTGSNDNDNPQLLERIRDLELNLATLSKLLALQKSTRHDGTVHPQQQQQQRQQQQQQHHQRGLYPIDNSAALEQQMQHQQHYRNVNATSSLSSTSRRVGNEFIEQQLLVDDTNVMKDDDDDNDVNFNVNNVPATNNTNRHERNLSLMFLFEGNQLEYERSRLRGNDERAMLASMTVAERQWLGPQILKQFKQQHQQQQQQQQQQPQTNRNGDGNSNNDIYYGNYRPQRQQNEQNGYHNRYPSQDRVPLMYVDGDEDDTTFRTDDDEDEYNERFSFIRSNAPHEQQLEQQNEYEEVPQIQVEPKIEHSAEEKRNDCLHDSNTTDKFQQYQHKEQQQQSSTRTSLTELFENPFIAEQHGADSGNVVVPRTPIEHEKNTIIIDSTEQPSKNDENESKTEVDTAVGRNSTSIISNVTVRTLDNVTSPLPAGAIHGASPSSIIEDQTKEDPDIIARSKWFDFLNSFQESTSDVDDQMEEFIQVPGKVEHVMTFGFFICVDSFLYMSTILPIRFVWNCFLLAIRTMHWTGLLTGATAAFQKKHLQFHRQHTYQIVQVLIIYTVYRFVLCPISIGKLYHWIRGQSMIKFYVIIAMVEIFDRLLSSLGQDCLDSMYWNTVSRPKSRRFFISILVVIIYVSIHTLILFVHVSTLNVAMNSADQALLTLLITGNFAEIKSTVFKKYNKAALFRITAGDICERFKLALFLLLILLLNLCQGMNRIQLVEYFRICCIVCGAELLSDWIKHCFVTKLNFLPSSVYPEYALVLAGDVTGFGHENINLDHSHAVVRRIGFAQIPLVVVMFRLIKEAYKYASFNVPTIRRYIEVVQRSRIGSTATSITSHPAATRLPFYYLWQILAEGGMYVIGWSILLIIKLALGSLLQRISQSKLQSASELFLSSNTTNNAISAGGGGGGSGNNSNRSKSKQQHKQKLS